MASYFKKSDILIRTNNIRGLMGEKSIDQDLKISRNKYKIDKSMWSKILKSTRQIMFLWVA